MSGRETINHEQQGKALLNIVDAMHREKNIPKDVIFHGIEAAVQLAIERSAGEEEEISVEIDRFNGQITAKRNGVIVEPEVLGRIAAQSAKQVMIQKIREAEGDSVFTDYQRRKGELVTGTIQRIDAGTAIVTLGKAEAILPRSEQIPGESHHVNERVKAVVMEVRKQGHRVKIVLSRCHPDFVRCLFENDIPEIADHTIEIKAVAREAGYRTKIAVSSIDMKVDCVGACVGVRGSRIKGIIDELGGERIDIVRWNDSLQVLIPNALQPATISDVFLYQRLGRAIVLVTEDQLSLAIGRRGQNVRLASKLVGWDIEIMTHDELAEGVERAEGWFSQVPGLSAPLIEALITEGFLSYTDLTFLEPTELAEMAGVTEEDADEMIAFAEEAAERVEEEDRAEGGSERGRRGHGASGAASALFPPAEGGEVKPTIESLFGPDATSPAPAETTVSAEQLFAELAESPRVAAEEAVAEPAADEAVAESVPEPEAQPVQEHAAESAHEHAPESAAGPAPE
jgi:N utilization substance protein A